MVSEEFIACQEAIAALTYSLAMAMPAGARAAFMQHLEAMMKMHGDGTNADTPRTRLLSIVKEVDEMLAKHRTEH